MTTPVNPITLRFQVKFENFSLASLGWPWRTFKFDSLVDHMNPMSAPRIPGKLYYVLDLDSVIGWRDTAYFVGNFGLPKYLPHGSVVMFLENSPHPAFQDKTTFKALYNNSVIYIIQRKNQKFVFATPPTVNF